jgi:hypothetical protein
MVSKLADPNGETKMQAPTTHIEVLEARFGKEFYGIADGMQLEVINETPKFFFVKIFSGHRAGQEIKISKLTKRSCHWGHGISKSPIFNI